MAPLPPLVVLYQTDNYMVIDKQYDIVINSNDSRESDVTVQNQLRSNFPQLSSNKLKHDFHFVHRLDYSTSGALCIALTKTAAREAMNAFSKRETQKYYLAVIRGHLMHEKLCIDVGIGQDSRPGCGHRMCTQDKEYCTNPKPAVTCLLVLERGFYDDAPATKVLLKPITGRRHQLRVHCNHIGNTIVGDFTYSDKTDRLPYRMFLHAFHLVIPTTLERIEVKTKDPFVISDARNKWKVSNIVHHLQADYSNLL